MRVRTNWFVFACQIGSTAAAVHELGWIRGLGVAAALFLLTPYPPSK